MDEAATYAIETEALTRVFDRVPAVDALNLRVPRGSFYGFLGPNGAGKSTTINVLTGLIAPTTGRATVLGLDLATQSLEIKRRIGVVPDGAPLFDRLTGAEHLEFVGRVYGLATSVVAERSEDLLSTMELTGEATKLVGSYSHGMRKKLALACALIHNPALLFLDEPFEGVDAVGTRQLRDLLVRLVASGHTTVFLTSHVLEVVDRLCTHIGIIHKGRLVADGAIEALRRGPDGVSRSLEDRFLEVVGADADRTSGLDWLGTVDGDPAGP